MIYLIAGVILALCFTTVFSIVYITRFIKYMVEHNLPLFTYGRCEWVSSNEENTGTVNPIGFTNEEETSSTVKEKSTREQYEEMLKDSASTISALLRGEVDFDDIKQN